MAGLHRTPSRLTAEPVAREERARLLDEVTRNGFIANYAGVRISSRGTASAFTRPSFGISSTKPAPTRGRRPCLRIGTFSTDLGRSCGSPGGLPTTHP